MKIAITSQGQELSSEIAPRFGQAKWLIVIDTGTGEVKAQKNILDLSASIFGIQTAQNIVGCDIEVVIIGNIGPNAFAVLRASGIRIFLCPGGTVGGALALLKAGKLNEVDVANVPGRCSF